MATNSYSNIMTIEKQKAAIGRRLDNYAKFYWRGEDMWEKYSAFIENDGSALKFVNGPSFSNQYSSPQYDHSSGNLTGVKFSRMKTSFKICVYGVTAEEYRSLIDALGPYEVDYLSFAYDDKLAYLAKTTDLKEAVKYVVGVNSDGADLYMAELNLTFEVQGEQCAIAQRQYIWRPVRVAPAEITSGDATDTYCLSSITISPEMLEKSELSFGVVGELTFKVNQIGNAGYIQLFISDKTPADWVLEGNDIGTYFTDGSAAAQLFQVELSSQTNNWQVSENSNTLLQEDYELTIKYDSASGLVFMKYDDLDYKILNLLTTNTYGDYMLQNEVSQKVKISKGQLVEDVYFVWRLKNLSFVLDNTNKIDPSFVNVYGRAKAILV